MEPFYCFRDGSRRYQGPEVPCDGEFSRLEEQYIGFRVPLGLGAIGLKYILHASCIVILRSMERVEITGRISG